jgi:hypothetical protein
MPFKPSREQTGAEAKKASGFVLYDIPPPCANGPEGNAVFYETPGIWASPPPRPPVSMPDSAGKRRSSAKSELPNPAENATPTSDEDKKASTTSSIFTKTRMCRFIALGLCRKGEACAYAHHKEELQPVPDLYKTKLCPAFFQQGSCKDPTCRFAHCKSELRTHSSLKRGSGDRSKKLSHITSPHKAGRLSNLAAPLPVGCTTPTARAKSKSGRELLPISKQSCLEDEIGVSTTSTDYPSDELEGFFFAPLQRMTTDSFLEMGHVVYPVPQLPFDDSDDEDSRFVLQSKNTFLELGPKKTCEDHYPRDTCHKAAGILFVYDSQLGA